MMITWFIGWIFFSILFSFVLEASTDSDPDIRVVNIFTATLLMILWPITAPFFAVVVGIYGVVHYVHKSRV